MAVAASTSATAAKTLTFISSPGRGLGAPAGSGTRTAAPSPAAPRSTPSSRRSFDAPKSALPGPVLEPGHSDPQFLDPEEQNREARKQREEYHPDAGVHVHFSPRVDDGVRMQREVD